jgi:hypothetical protein
MSVCIKYMDWPVSFGVSMYMTSRWQRFAMLSRPFSTGSCELTSDEDDVKSYTRSFSLPASTSAVRSSVSALRS